MCGTVLLYGCWGALPAAPLLSWYAFLAVTCLGVYAHWWYVAGSESGPPRQQTTRLMMWAAAFAAPWMLISFWAIGALPQVPEMVLLTGLAAMASNGAIYRAPLPPAAIIYVAMMLLPIIAKCLLLEDAGYRLLAVLNIGYAGFLGMIIATSARQWRERTKVATINAELVAGFPGGMAMLDARGHVLVMNDGSRPLLRLLPANEAAARRNLMAHLETHVAPALADEAARTTLQTFIEAVRSRKECAVHIEYADHTAVAYLGRPAAGGHYLTIFKDITPLHRETKRLERSARSDPLTQLLNRAGLEERLETAMAQQQPFAILALDLDKFKRANDTYGHAAGDAVLKTVAKRITEFVRDCDSVARVGGDEFVVVLRDRSDTAEMIAARLEAAISTPVQFEGVEITVGVSIGIARSDGGGQTADDLTRAADQALYRVKRGRKSDVTRNAA